MRFTQGRHRQVDTTGHFCPYATCSYHGRVDFGNSRANGHPNGRRWRQLVCLGGHGYFLETIDTPFHGKQVDADQLVWAITALAEGLGIRAVARVFETDPNTVLPHASLQLLLPECDAIGETDSGKRWQPQTPARAAGLTDRVWSLREVLMDRVPPWPQSQMT